MFVVVNVYAVLRPTNVTWLAHQLGVGRGTDLVLYVIVLAMGFLTLNTFLRFRSLEKKITDLARTVAIKRACRPTTSASPAQDIDRGAGGGPTPTPTP